jgi:hypothetical protein
VIGYPKAQIIETLTTLYGLSDADAHDLYARESEDTLSAEEELSTL